MITLDKEKCTQCSLCITRFAGYCITEKDGYPVFDYTICNLCQKCVAICPSRAIMVNNTPPLKIEKGSHVKPENLYTMFRQRRSIKLFKKKEIPRDIIKKIIDIAKYAPNQNKNIDMIVIDDKGIIDFIDKKAYSFYKKIYRFIFTFAPFEWVCRLFFRDSQKVKRKMERDLFFNRQIVKKGTQVLIIVAGNKKAPATTGSAYCILAAIMYYAESMGIGTCLMDSLTISINVIKKIKQKLHIKKPVLGVLSLGYSAENILNIPQGYELNIRWNNKILEEDK